MCVSACTPFYGLATCLLFAFLLRVLQTQTLSHLFSNNICKRTTLKTKDINIIRKWSDDKMNYDYKYDYEKKWTINICVLKGFFLTQSCENILGEIFGKAQDCWIWKSKCKMPKEKCKQCLGFNFLALGPKNWNNFPNGGVVW